MEIFVLETYGDNGAEWGITFDGHNPKPEDYFKMPDRETAFRFRDRLTAKVDKKIGEVEG